METRTVVVSCTLMQQRPTYGSVGHLGAMIAGAPVKIRSFNRSWMCGFKRPDRRRLDRRCHQTGRGSKRRRVNERTHREIAPDKAGIETDRIRPQQVESSQTEERPSAPADEHKLFADKELVKPTAPHKGESETARIQGDGGESFQTRPPVAAHRVGEQGKQQIGLNTTGNIRPTDEQIARRAYELYLDRGQTPGHELVDGLQAKRELS